MNIDEQFESIDRNIEQIKGDIRDMKSALDEIHEYITGQKLTSHEFITQGAVQDAVNLPVERFVMKEV